MVTARYFSTLDTHHSRKVRTMAPGVLFKRPFSASKLIQPDVRGENLFFFFGCAVHGLGDLSSPTRDRTQSLGSESVEF